VGFTLSNFLYKPSVFGLPEGLQVRLRQLWLKEGLHREGGKVVQPAALPLSKK